MPLRRITRQTVLRAETPHQAGLMGIDALAGRLEHSAQMLNTRLEEGDAD